MEVETIRLVPALLAPLIGALLVIATGKHPNLREACSFVAAAVLFAIVSSLVPDVWAGSRLSYRLFRILPGISVSFRADHFSLIFALVASFLWMVTVFYSLGYMRGLKEHAQTRFNACFALALFGAIGCAFADNLFTLYLFYEVVSISTYTLVAHHQDREGYESGEKYLVYLISTVKGMVLPAMVGIYFLTGTLDFAANIKSGILPAGSDRTLVTILYICCLAGFAKNAIMPFHNWLPSAMVAPTPVSALLHAVAVVKVGVFSTTRVMLYVFGVDLMDAFNLGIPTAYFVSITILVGSVIALSKDNLKACLAYSTISQLSYVILGVALLTPSGIQGGLVHIANHAVSKITLFFCAGAIYVATRKKDISELNGLGHVMPFTFSAFAVASLSMIGVPPVAGFVSKWYLAIGSLEAHQTGLLMVLLASTLLNAGYFVPITYRAFFGTLAPADRGLKEASPAMVIPLLITAAISFIIGIFPGFFMSLVKGVLR
ncbi:MAG: monovalent cation/H+ antiporter subunit D family protein [Syntrophales bacterium]|nr:monovalent cation/H+ antiporter subunit D family protein [Syntrophales bacterium]